MAIAKQGDKVKVHYTGSLSDGTIFDSSNGKDPLEFSIGGGQVIPGFEKGAEGMEVGSKKTIQISKEEAYGDYRDDLIVNFAKDQIPSEINPEVGQQYQMMQENGQPIIVTVREISEDSVVLDANHPLAGQDLTFDLELVEIMN